MDISSFLQLFFLLIIAAIAGLAFLVSYYYKTENGRLRLDGIKLKIPVFGDLERKAQ